MASCLTFEVPAAIENGGLRDTTPCSLVGCSESFAEIYCLELKS